MSKTLSDYSQNNGIQDIRHWLVHKENGPVLATAVHAGHQIRDELKPFLHADEHKLHRDEDPMTGVWAAAGDNIFVNYRSRFEVDLNRSRELALATEPEHTWGQKIWHKSPPSEMIERSLRQHDFFYAMMKIWLEDMIRQHGKILVLDIHSYNHRRDGEDAPPAPQAENPDIDLGLTTLDHDQFGPVAEAMTEGLSALPCGNRQLDVRSNVRYPDGGYWPEWVFANFGQDVCTISLEYKKFYMDEWTGQCSLPVANDLKAGLNHALKQSRKVLSQCR